MILIPSMPGVIMMLILEYGFTKPKENYWTCTVATFSNISDLLIHFSNTKRA